MITAGTHILEPLPTDEAKEWMCPLMYPYYKCQNCELVVFRKHGEYIISGNSRNYFAEEIKCNDHIIRSIIQ